MNKHIGIWTSLGVVGAFVVPGCGSSAPVSPPLASMSAQQVLNRAITSAEGEQAVHARDTGTMGALTGEQSDDALRTSGQQVIVTGSEDAEVRVVGGVAYIKGNLPAITNYFGFPATLAPSLANRWVAIPPGSQDYVTVASEVTLPSLLATFRLVAPLTKLPAMTVDSQRVVGIRGSAPDAAGLPADTVDTVYVSVTGPMLPVGAVITSKSTNTVEDITFSRWGEKLTVAKPSRVLPATAIQGPRPA